MTFYERKITNRVRNGDGTEDITLECGHETTCIIPLPSTQEVHTCAECVNQTVRVARTGRTQGPGYEDPDA